MKPYTDMPECIKCGFANVSLLYIPSQFFFGLETKEYIECECNRCGYTWNMATKDKKC